MIVDMLLESNSNLSAKGGLSFIEQLQKLSSKECTRIQQTPFLTGVNHDEKISLLIKPTCKQWDCETCGYRNARLWIARIINGINRLDGEWSFLTITAHKKWRKASSVANLRQGWKKLINRIAHQAKKEDYPLYYARVWEQHEDGSFHLHVLLNICLSSRWAKDNSRQCGMGQEADWHSVQNAGMVAGYMAKYTLKNATTARGGINWPKGLRRIETSRNWPVLPRIDGMDNLAWIINQTRDGQMFTAHKYESFGYHTVDKVPISAL